ncbi:MAG TPA: serine/threonine-protein kinase, partial [Verrucomicrobiaceae bacterium]
MSPQDDSTPPVTSRSSAGSAGAGWEPPAPERLQGMLQGYEVIEIIGRGGMGAVYKARQISLDRVVAIKILPPAIWDDEEDYAERFRTEARMMAKLMHPGMIAVFDFGETPDGQLYFIMEHVAGTDVSQMIAKQGMLPPLHALAIAAHVCDTLRYAHEHGIIHRDIKPANVMVDLEGRVKVADFGLAKLASQDTSQSKSKMTLGTPDFIAPEALIMGAAVDHRADLFSLGVMLYEMLTSRVPHGDFVPPRNIVPGLDKRFDAIVARAMQREPEARYQSAAEFRKALDHILAVPVVVEKPGTGSARPGRRGAGAISSNAAPKGHPIALMAAAVVTMAAIGAYFLFRGSPPQEIAREAREEPAVVSRDVSPLTAAAPKEKPKPKPVKPATQPVIADATHSPQPVAKKAAPPPMPEVPATPQPETETTRKLRELEGQFQAAFDRDVTKVHETAVASLDGKYGAALERALTTAKNAGNLPEALALRDEKERVESHQSLPAEDASDLPES